MDVSEICELYITKGYDGIDNFDHFPTDKKEERNLIILTMIQKWLRDYKDIKLISLPYTMYPLPEIKYVWMIQGLKSSTANKVYFNTYEEALKEGIIQSLKLL